MENEYLYVPQAFRDKPHVKYVIKWDRVTRSFDLFDRGVEWGGLCLKLDRMEHITLPLCHS